MKREIVLGSVVFGVLVSAQAFANLSGTWMGLGAQMDLQQGSLKSCDQVIYQIRHTDSQFRIMSSYSCDGKTVTYQSGVIQIREGKLFRHDDQVGTLSEDKADLQLDTLGGSIELHIEKSGDAVGVQETRMTLSPPSVTAYQASLMKVN